METSGSSRAERNGSDDVVWSLLDPRSILNSANPQKGPHPPGCWGLLRSSETEAWRQRASHQFALEASETHRAGGIGDRRWIRSKAEHFRRLFGDRRSLRIPDSGNWSGTLFRVQWSREIHVLQRFACFLPPFIIAEVLVSWVIDTLASLDVEPGKMFHAMTVPPEREPGRVAKNALKSSNLCLP